MDFARMCSRLDPRCYKAFLAVVSEGSFSAAASSAAMTISGVSQHIANIESAVGAQLFLRTASGCKLTDPGRRFHQFVKSYSNLLADLFEDVAETQGQLQGIVRYAMPPSCILSPHFPMLLQRRLAHPDLELNVTLMPNGEIIRALLGDQIDFGFVTETVRNPAVAYKAFCQEEYILVGSERGRIEDITEADFLDQPFVVYPGFDTYVACYIKHFFPSLADIDARSIYRVSGMINTIDGAIRMVTGGLGISVFPRHCVQALIDKGELFEHRRHAADPLLNDIHIAHHAANVMPRRVGCVIDWFMDMVH